MVAIAKPRLIICISPPVSKNVFFDDDPDSRLATLILVYCRGNQLSFTGLGQNLSPVVNQIHEKLDDRIKGYDGLGRQCDAC
jgi:hypothetical protein